MGFPTDWFVEPVDESLTCNVCYSVLEKPTAVCQAGHTLCGDCADDWKKRSDECPECRSTMCGNIICRPLQTMILALKVHCCPEENERRGAAKRARVAADDGASVSVNNTTPVVSCEWEGTLSDFLEKHRDHECQVREVKCPLGCGEVLRAFQSPIPCGSAMQAPPSHLRRMRESTEAV